MLLLVNLKALIVILAVATAVFAVTKPICLAFMAEQDFVRRRNLWLSLTAAAFLIPDFWLFAIFAAGLLFWAARRDANPVALYLLLMHVIPPTVKMEIPVIGINALFELSFYRILAFAVLIPAALMLRKNNREHASRTAVSIDAFLIAYGVLHLVLLMPYESFTNTLRRGFLYGIDVLLVYFVVSRLCSSRRLLAEALAAFCLAGAIHAPLAVFETLKGWELYREIGAVWGDPAPFAYLYRGESLRAQVSVGHALALGYAMAIAFGFWLYVSSAGGTRSRAVWGGVWMWSGLLAAYSRAPWLVAVCILFCYLALSPTGSRALFKGLAVGTLLAAGVLVSPLGDVVIDNLPFVGSVDDTTVVYRQRLAEASWEVIKRNPVLGDPFFLLHLEHLRQGQGIIDLVNTYATIAMNYGLAGLALFLAPFLIGMRRAYRTLKASAGNPDLSLLGACLLACMVGTLLMMATGSFGTVLAQMYYVLAGFAAGFAVIRQQEPGKSQTSLLHQARPGWSLRQI